jgi:hypothetical protein
LHFKPVLGKLTAYKKGLFGFWLRKNKNLLLIENVLKHLFLFLMIDPKVAYTMNDDVHLINQLVHHLVDEYAALLLRLNDGVDDYWVI